ncbi:hypothetical protein ElyMa_004536600 [Elysia marginata]|uniref:Uncharacterized protein n=1 Tax=Elysia marginata TaxID=1093978 RepID=A0AAV4HST4_9GAST|nr:hypothetical protein ElyMa_004536600 [Elysia marginata]
MSRSKKYTSRPEKTGWTRTLDLSVREPNVHYSTTRRAGLEQYQLTWQRYQPSPGTSAAFPERSTLRRPQQGS